eukprot:CAMPEP_0168191868 /NCGR_PEP_ID=MMETSP0139_2-20121125/17745_1 /TAXON_ID=44445 /ORGANISM="Pseudo-nitzschia australis, Strain 10249 10 AB" /LENGTH=165 /DNA_ID=CAMNT_0008115071 /DNA_START=114 /DNA_END=611 /DNA_ORIENTATION=+
MIRSVATKISKLPIQRTGWLRREVLPCSSKATDSREHGAMSTSGNRIAKRPYASTTLAFKTVSITYVEPDGTSKTVDAEVGDDLMTVAHDNDIELEGACGGELACSTCHLIFDLDIYDTLPEKEDEEDDMLDLAFEVTETSRLGCQIPVQENFDGIKVQIPDDGF